MSVARLTTWPKKDQAKCDNHSIEIVVLGFAPPRGDYENYRCARWEGSTRAKENHKSYKLDIYLRLHSDEIKEKS